MAFDSEIANGRSSGPRAERAAAKGTPQPHCNALLPLTGPCGLFLVSQSTGNERCPRSPLVLVIPVVALNLQCRVAGPQPQRRRREEGRPKRKTIHYPASVSPTATACHTNEQARTRQSKNTRTNRRRRDHNATSLLQGSCFIREPPKQSSRQLTARPQLVLALKYRQLHRRRFHSQQHSHWHSH